MADYAISATLSIINDVSTPTDGIIQSINRLTQAIDSISDSSAMANRAMSGLTQDKSQAIDNETQKIRDKSKADWEEYQAGIRRDKERLKAEKSHIKESEKLQDDTRKIQEKEDDEKTRQDVERFREREREEIESRRRTQDEQDQLARQEADRIDEQTRRDVERLRQIEDEGRQVGRSLNEIGMEVISLGRKMERVGRWLSIRVTAPIMAAGGASYKFANDFSRSMGKIEAIFGPTTERMKELQDIALNLSNETGKPIDDIAIGMYRVMQSFGDSEDTMKKLSMAAKYSVPLVTDVAEALEYATDMAQNFDDKSVAGFKHYYSLGFRALREGRLNFEQLSEAVKKGGQIAKGLGISPEEFMASQIIMGEKMGGARASTAFAYIMSRIQGSPAAISALGKVGYINFWKAVSDLGAKDPSAIEKAFGGSRTVNAVEALAGTSGNLTENIKKLAAAVDDGDKAFVGFTEGVGRGAFIWDQFKTKIHNLGVTLGTQLQIPISELYNDYLGPLLDRIAKLDTGTWKWIIAISGIAAVVGPTIVVLGNLSVAIGGLTTAIGYLNAVSLPWISAAGAIGLAVYFLYKFIESAWKAAKALTVVFTALFNYVLNKETWEPVLNFFSKLWEIISNIAKEIGGTFVNMGATLFGIDIGGKQLVQEKSQVDVNVRVQADPGSNAMISDSKSNGANLNLASESYVGAY